jgi:hypothetical protein
LKKLSILFLNSKKYQMMKYFIVFTFFLFQGSFVLLSQDTVEFDTTKMIKSVSMSGKQRFKNHVKLMIANNQDSIKIKPLQKIDIICISNLISYRYYLRVNIILVCYNIFD